MRKFIQVMYLILLRGQGGLVLLAGLMTLMAIPQNLNDGLFIKVPTIFAVISCLLALIALIPKLTPRWMTNPGNGFVGFGVSMIYAVAPFFFMMTMFSSALVFGYGLEDPMTRIIAIGMNVISFSVFGLLWLTVLILGICPDDAAEPYKRPTYAAPPPIPREQIDIRSLRKSRTG